MESPLFVLTPYVYAKKQDGGFHSGRIEGKENENTYKIAFPDHTRSIVDENDLVWLGFYRLPPHTWPKSPAIYPVKFPKDDDMFYNVDIKREDDYYSSQRPDSLRIIKNIKDLSRNGERKLSGEKYFSSEHCRCANNVNDDNINFEAASTSEDRMRRRQARTSVLRLNRKALSAEISQKQNEYEMCSSTLDISTTENEWTRYNVGRERHFSSGSLQSTSPHPSPYNQHDPPYFNAPCLTPPSTPISLPPPLFVCNPYETAGFSEMNSGEWGQMDRRDVGGGKRKRRDNMKKCRKVYGIDNRDLWCTQCKWKKACSRFQIGNYVQRHF